MKIQITNWMGLCRFLFHGPFVLGYVLDLFVLPLAGLMMLLKMIIRQDFDTWFRHPKHLPPVLLIHGSGSNEAQWLFVRWRYRHQFNMYSIQLNSLPLGDDSTDMEQMALVVQNKIQAIYRECNQKVILVGHSMGGLVAAQYAEGLDPQGLYVARIVTLGSPFRGAPALQYVDMGTKRHEWMRPQSPFLVALNEKMAHTKHQYKCYGSPSDFQVPIPYSYPTYQNCEYCNHVVGHTSLMLFCNQWSI